MQSLVKSNIYTFAILLQPFCCICIQIIDHLKHQICSYIQTCAKHNQVQHMPFLKHSQVQHMSF